jgi:hypothetical protein
LRDLQTSSETLRESADLQERNAPMTLKTLTRILVLPVAPVVVALTLALSTGAASVSASFDRNRPLHVTKECTEYFGQAGEFCTITGSNLGIIKIGSRVYYDQAAGVPEGMLDSNVVLDAGYGNRAVGRCTLDDATGQGLCTFSDGTGRFAGFNARVRVSPPPPGGTDWRWDGTYSFSPLD